MWMWMWVCVCVGDRIGWAPERHDKAGVCLAIYTQQLQGQQHGARAVTPGQCLEPPLHYYPTTKERGENRQ